MAKIHTPEMQIAELTEALNFVRQKYQAEPTKMIMNSHTRDELVDLANCETPDFAADVVLWEDLPVQVDDTLDDHKIVFDMPEKVDQLETVNS